MRWKLNGPDILRLQCGLLLSGGSGYNVHRDSCVMCLLRGGKRVYRKCRTAGCMYLYCRVRLKFNNIKWLYDDNGTV